MWMCPEGGDDLLFVSDMIGSLELVYFDKIKILFILNYSYSMVFQLIKWLRSW